MKAKVLVVVAAGLITAGCSKAQRLVDSEITAIRDQTKVLEKIERHLAVIANAKESEVRDGE